MAVVEEVEEVAEPEFKWGTKRGVGGKKKDVQFYESFTYDGVDYALYDCVYMHKEGESVPYIGKLVKIWQNSDGTKRIKVHWFFLPSEISYYLRDVEVLENEIFFASGAGAGLANLNPPEAIAGKCNVVCVSSDTRNPQPSAEELQMADFIFYRTFNVGSCTISDQMDDAVGGVEVKFVFNIKETDSNPDVPRLGWTSNVEERNAVACKEIPNLAGKNLPEQLNKLKADKNGLRRLEIDDTDVKQVQVEKETVAGETKEVSLNKESEAKREISRSVAVKSSTDNGAIGNNTEKTCTSGAEKVGCKVNGDSDKIKEKKSLLNPVQVEERVKSAKKSDNLDDTRNISPAVAVKSSKVKEAIGKNIEKSSILGANNVDMQFSGAGDKIKDQKSLVNLVQGEERVKCARKSDNLDDTPLKRVKVGGTVTSSRVKDTNGVQNLIIPGKDAVAPHMVTCTTSSNAKNSAGSEKDNQIAENMSAFRGKPSTSGNSANETPKSLTANVPPSGLPKSGNNKDFEGPGQAAKSVKSPSAAAKKPSKTSAELSREKPTPKHDDGHENKDITLAKDLCPSDVNLKNSSVATKRPLKTSADLTKEKPTSKHDGHEDKDLPLVKDSSPSDVPLKKAKIAHSIKIPEDYDSDNNSNKKLKGKVCSRERKSSSMLGTPCDDKGKSKIDNSSLKDCHSEKAPKLSTSKDDVGKVEAKVFEVTRRPIVEQNKWIKLPWEERMKDAHEHGKLALLQNLDPEYTSGEVEDIIWFAFSEKCTAEMVQHTANSNPYSGQAFVIFKSRETVDKVLQKLDDRCLVLPNKRPLVILTGVTPKFEKNTTFAGHLAIDKARRQMQRELKDAVSTSHYSQNNTVEYEMAMSWCLLQSKSDKWWELLYEQQRKELKKLAGNLKLK